MQSIKAIFDRRNASPTPTPLTHHSKHTAQMSSFNYNGPFLDNPGEGETPIIVWGYRPSLAFALVGAITFGLLALGQLFWAIRWKGMYRTFHILLFVGAVSRLSFV